MLRCARFRGSKAAGRLGVARRYTSTNSNETSTSSHPPSSENDPTNSISTASSSPEREHGATQPIDEGGSLKEQNGDVLKAQPEGDVAHQFPAFKRLALPNHKRITVPKPQSKPPQPARRHPSYADYVTPSHLPVSPLMDPSFNAARSKHHLPKPQPVAAELTPFQMQLRNNPYALALATPVRMCNVTRVTLPKFFMQDYNLLAHPEGDSVWWMPSGVVKKGGVEKQEMEGIDLDKKIVTEDDNVQGENKANTDVENGSLNGSLSEEAKGKSIPKSLNRLLGPTVYILLRKEFLYALSNKKKTGYSAAFEKSFVDSQLLKNPNARNLFSKAHWRVDIDEFLLELMRRRVVEELSYILKRHKGYVTGCKNWEDALAKPQVGAYLWTGTSEDDNKPPPEFATLDLGVSKKRKVPTHNLKFLLGRDKLGDLKAVFGNDIFENDVLALRHRRRTVGLQMRLWRLQGYLAEYRDTP